MLGIRGIGYNRVNIERGIFMVLVKKRPVLFQRVAVPRDNIRWFDSAHDQIHTREVVGIFLQFLRVILDSIGIGHMLRRTLTDVNEQ